MSETIATATENPKSKPDLGKSPRFRWRRYLAYLAILLVLLYLVSLVILNTSWAKNKLTQRLREKTHSDWELGSVLWVPLGDIVINDLQTSMGEGGIKIQSISVEPSWNQIFSGQLEIIEAKVNDADVDLDLKWLAENRGAMEEMVSVPQPEQSPQPNSLPQPNPSQPGTNPPAQPSPPTTQKPTENPAPEILTKPDFSEIPNRWIKLEKVNLTLRHGEKIIEEISNLTASIPIAGKPVKGEVKFQFLGDEHVQEIAWNGVDLSAEETTGKFSDVHFQWRALCRIGQTGMPFAFQLVVPQQKLNHVIDKPNIHLSASSDKIAVNFIVNGGLKNPNTWRGILNAISENTTIIENQKTHKRLDFDYTRLVATLSQGNFHIPVAEAIGHKTSIIANGSVHKNLYSYGTVRMIANQESAETIERVYHGTKLINIDHASYYFLAPLGTPDRMYCDIYVDGKLTDLEIRHDRSDHWQRLNPAIKALLDFKNKELKEDGLLEEE